MEHITTAPAPFLEVRGCTVFLQGDRVLNDLSFSMREGEFLSVLGPSGCGKTTLLRVIAGLQIPKTGSVFKRGHDITKEAPDRRGIGIVFQNYALFENMTAWKNVAYALRFHPECRGKEKEIAREMLQRVGLGDFLNKYPSQLSGGQQQRVAIARTLVLSPDLILFDEPMAALDAETRLHLRDEIKRLQKEFSAAILYVTHDQEEAFSLSDRIMVMEAGSLHQLDTPRNLLSQPADDYVRRFVGENLRRRTELLVRFTGGKDFS